MRVSKLTGLTMCSSKPASRERSKSRGCPKPVTATIVLGAESQDAEATDELVSAHHGEPDVDQSATSGLKSSAATSAEGPS